jgi:hypothetical protein
MPVIPRKVLLQKTLKVGLRRCVYRRWEAAIQGGLLITKATELERMYRGNTPYPIGKPKVTQQAFASTKTALLALSMATQRRVRLGYKII